MLTVEENELLCRTDAGTPGGEYMRRYWHPVGLSKEVAPGGQPLRVRVLGEDLVLSYLHQDNWSRVKRKLADLPKPRLEFKETEYGIWQKSWLPSVQVDRS